MSKVSSLGQLANFLCYITLQLCITQFTLRDHTVMCFFYVTFLLLLPRQQAGLSFMLLISFLVGLLVDIFYNSMGAHAFASVLLVYSRAILLQRILPIISNYETVIQPTLSNLGWKRFSLVSLILIGIHHAAFFLLEAGSPMLFFAIMRKVVLSTLLTYCVVMATQGILLFLRRS